MAMIGTLVVGTNASSLRWHVKTPPPTTLTNPGTVTTLVICVATALKFPILERAVMSFLSSVQLLAAPVL